MLTTTQLYLDKACQVNLNYTAAECREMSNNTRLQVEVQELVARVQAYNGVLQSLPGMPSIMIV